MIPGRGQPPRSRHGATGVCDKAEKSGSQHQQYTMKKIIITTLAIVAITGGAYAQWKCQFCNGTGWKGQFPCPYCHGTGRQ